MTIHIGDASIPEEEFERILGDNILPIVEKRSAWRAARLERDQAQLALDHAQKALRLEVDHFWLEVPVKIGTDPDNLSALMFVHFETAASIGEPQSPRQVLDSVDFVGLSIAQACRRALSRTGGNYFGGQPAGYSSEELAERLKQGGYEFTSEVPAREVHGALVKQHWVEKNPKTGKWQRKEQP